jgi:DNA-binding MarR family transcriptional regulator
MSTRRAATRHQSLVIEIRKFIAGAIFFNQKVAERFGLNLTDTQCLNVLEMAGSATPGQLAAQTGLTTGGITVVLDRLEKAGFVKREPNPEDRRSLIVRPLPENLARIQAIYADIHKGLGQLFAGYSDKELDIIVSFFEKSNAMRAAE